MRTQHLAAAVGPEDEYETQEDYDKTVAAKLQRLLDRLEPYLDLVNEGLAADVPKDLEDKYLESAKEALNSVKLSLANNLIELRFFTLKVIDARGMQKIKDAIWTDDPQAT